ncbi:hypothetical protein AB0L03_35830, partial [Streptomyces roseoverticillatus]
YDVVKETLSGLAGEEGSVAFRRLAMQPGKPQAPGFAGVVPPPGSPGSDLDGDCDFFGSSGSSDEQAVQHASHRTTRL